MSKAKFAAAKELIEQKKYPEARAILKTIDHPAAQEWLQRLDRIEARPGAAKRKLPGWWLNAALGGVLAMGIVIVVLLVSADTRQQQTSDDSLATIQAATAIMQNIAQNPTLNSGITLAQAATQQFFNAAATQRSALGTAVAASSTPTPPPTDLSTSMPAPGLSEAGCDDQAWWQQARPVVVRFLDSAETASRTAHDSLGPIVQQMRDAQRDYENVGHPDCVSDIYWNIEGGMDDAARGYKALVEDESASGGELEQASQYFWNADQELTVRNLDADTRMSNASSLIWGGTGPDAARGTQMANSSVPGAQTAPQVDQATGAPDDQPSGSCDASAWASNVQATMAGLENASLDAQTVDQTLLLIQDAYSEIARQPYPQCLTLARNTLLSALNDLISASEAVEDGDFEVVRPYIDNARADLQAFQTAFQRATGQNLQPQFQQIQGLQA